MIRKSIYKIQLSKFRSLFFFGIFSAGLLALVFAFVPFEPIIWKLGSLDTIGTYKPVVFGKPGVIKDKSGASLSFNGLNDGLTIPKNPVEGWRKFTIEVLFMPDADGPGDPRFVHFQDKDDNRGTLEIRINAKKRWYLDTFLKNGKPEKPDRGLSLIDSALSHPTGQWYWVAMVYDGQRMSSYVNGQKEIEGNTNFPVMTSGEISVGMRLNKVNWFKGLIKEIRFHPDALQASLLQK